MPAGSWISAVQGLTTLLTGAASALQRRGSLKVIGTPVFDDGTQTVLGGVQIITGSGTWDGKSAMIHVKGSGARSIALPDPDATLQYPGLTIGLCDFVGNSNAGTITFGTGAEFIGINVSATITTRYQTKHVQWLSTGQWSEPF
jgi:hypothetical protein